MKYTSKAILTLVFTASMSAASPTLADTAAAPPEGAEPDYSKLFDGMISRLAANLKASKLMVSAREAELKKIQKGAESAKWRVNTAHEQFDEAIASGNMAKVGQAQSLLKQDAVKLGTMLARGREICVELEKQSASLKSDTDDVGIETDRFPETDHRRKRNLQMISESEWVQNHSVELCDFWKNEVEGAVAETFAAATVSSTPDKVTPASFDAPGQFGPLAGVAMDQFKDASGASRFAHVGQVHRDKTTCEAWCTIDDASGLRGNAGDLQLRCVASANAPSAADSGGVFVISHWQDGKVSFPASSRINELPCK
jgi:hypothetical protein